MDTRKSKKRYSISLMAIVASICVLQARSASTTETYSEYFSDPYIKAGIGGAIYKDFKARPNWYPETKQLKSNQIYNVGFGYSFRDNIRADLNFSYGKWQYKSNYSHVYKSISVRKSVSQKGMQQALILSGYYDFYSKHAVSPYITAGVGVSRIAPKPLIVPPVKVQAKNRFGFAWNAGAGLKYTIKKKYIIDVEYLYASFGKIKSVGSFNSYTTQASQNIAAHQMLLSLHYIFGLKN